MTACHQGDGINGRANRKYSRELGTPEMAGGRLQTNPVV